jgi:polyisoprenoid-binding protein YceI
MTPRGPIAREQAGSPAGHPDGVLGGRPCQVRPSSPGVHARIGLPAALHEVGSPATVASLPAGAPAGSSPTQAEGITACAFSIATVIEASAGRSGGNLASAEPEAMGIAGAYRLGPESGRLLVHTTRTGLGAKAGHDLTIEVTRWHGHATVDTAVPANSSVTIQIDVDSFQVREGTGGVKPLTDADRAEISKTLKQVLHTAQHPTITFWSRRVDGSAGSFTLDGELEIRASPGRSRSRAV